MTNSDLCLKIFDFLKHSQVETVVVCAGARNAPFVFHLENENFKKNFYFEERSAAFFALGLMKSSGKPVAIITTSGTAAAELLPATIESYYQGLPLILITADRPKGYRNTGAPQTINQVGLYSDYVEKTFDWDVFTTNFDCDVTLQKPLHFNVCFDEPLNDKKSLDYPKSKTTIIEKQSFATATADDFRKIINPLIIVGQIEESQKSAVIKLIETLKAPVYLESLSQLRGTESIHKYVIDSTDTLVKKIILQKWCDSILRIGGVPTLRFWRDLEKDFLNTAVYNFTDLQFTGLARKTTNFKMDFSHVLQSSNANLSKIFEINKDLQLKKNELLTSFPLSEPAFVSNLSAVIADAPIYLGNSLPIREWDLFSHSGFFQQKVYANRGANGIDGQVSTYLGWSQNMNSSYCLIGDLTTMYDLAALGLKGESNSASTRVVIMNNFGGHIFKRVFNNEHFLNAHQLEFVHWSKMWKWSYLLIKSPEDFKNIPEGQKLIIEIQPDSNQTQEFWDAWDFLCSRI